MTLSHKTFCSDWVRNQDIYDTCTEERFKRDYFFKPKTDDDLIFDLPYIIDVEINDPVFDTCIDKITFYVKEIKTQLTDDFFAPDFRILTPKTSYPSEG